MDFALLLLKGESKFLATASFLTKAQIQSNVKFLTSLNGMARNEWIALVTRSAIARRGMIDNAAVSIESTSAWAGISTFLVAACFVTRTIRVHAAFWTTTRVWIPLVLG